MALKILFAALLVLCIGAHAKPARADEQAAAKEQTPAQKETARRLMDTGDQRLADGDLEGALVAFNGADEIMRVPTTSLALAKVQMQLGMLTEAVDSLRRAARFPKQSREPEVIARARTEASQLDFELAKRIPSITIIVKGVAGDKNARVTVDGDVVPRESVGLPFRVNPGDHAVVGTADGYKQSSLTIRIEEQEAKRVVLQFIVDPSYRPPSTGTSDANARRAPAADTFPYWVLIATGFGVAGVGATVGAVTGAVSLSKTADLKAECGQEACDDRLTGELDTILALANVSNVSFAIAGAGAVVGVVGLILELGAAEGDAARVAPMLTPFGIGWTTSF